MSEDVIVIMLRWLKEYRPFAAECIYRMIVDAYLEFHARVNQPS